MTNYYCTLFDSNYLTRGLAMYRSLAENDPDFHLYVYAMDDRARQALLALALPSCTIHSIADIQDPVLSSLEKTRSRVEFCWTSTPFILEHVLQVHERGACTYLDADIFFYGAPGLLHSELPPKSVLLTEHRYTPEYDQTETSGKYCVQFITFLNDAWGRKVLSWWKNACVQACELNPESGLCGDQKYLDDWTERFEGVHVLQHLGGGVAPWNVQQYEVLKSEDAVGILEASTGASAPLVFYHFHGLRIFDNGFVQLTGPGYRLARETVQWIYRPYLSALRDSQIQIDRAGFSFNGHGIMPVTTTRHPFLQGARRRLRDLQKRFLKNDYNNLVRFP